MHRQLHFTPAIAAITFVLCLAGFAFVVVALLPSPFAQQFVATRRMSDLVLHLGMVTGLLLLTGYAAGIAGWLAMFALRCDGMHRLWSVLEHPRAR